VSIFEKKANLTAHQESHIQLKTELADLKTIMIADISSVPEKLLKLQDKCNKLKGTLNPMELIFGTPTDFECVNSEGESKSISSLLEGKSHVLIYFSAHWCPPCRSFTPVLAQAYRDATSKNCEVIFLSSDGSETEFQS